MQITMDCARELGAFRHFWQSTGLTPASLLLNADMRQQVIYAGAIPHGGISYARVHYLLDLVRGEDLLGENPRYDWPVLDTALDLLVQNGLKPFFELMGNPAGYFTDFHDDRQLHAWRRLVARLAGHYRDRYGHSELLSWVFETWNEPDGHWWTQDEEAFCNYYDACCAGLWEVDPQIQMGGPGTCRDLSPLLKAFLAHCDTGRDYFTGDAVRVDFLSVHVKGVRSSPEDLTPRSQQMVDRERAIVEYITANHPRLAGVPFMNNECDPQVGWWDTHTWRGRPYYAAFVCKVIDQHLRQLADGLRVNYRLLSNDNGFVGGWGNRTLCARFGDIQDVKAQSEHKTKDDDLQEDVSRRRFEMIKKPVLNVMALLSLLGDRRCAVTLVGEAPAGLGAIATLRVGQVAVLVYHSPDAPWESGQQPIDLMLDNLPFPVGSQPMLVHYRVDEQHSNPFRLWDDMGGPAQPSMQQYADLRDAQELEMAGKPAHVTATGRLAYRFGLRRPGVSLILLSVQPESAPGQVMGLRAERYEGLTGQDEVMLVWDGLAERTLRTYEVLYSTGPGQAFARVNTPDLISGAFLHVRQPNHVGQYCVRAVDYWGREGQPSDTVEA